MNYFLCGIIIGIVMGLTGAGGALVAIPLFIQFLGIKLKEATVLSLLAVILASLMNFVAQRKETQYRTGLLVVIFSAIGSVITSPLKEKLSPQSMALLLAFVSSFALFRVWFPGNIRPDVDHSTSQKSLFITGVVGILLGALTTTTGLGGGVLMLPIYLQFFHYSAPQSVATSLFSVGLSSLVSFGVQLYRGPNFPLKFDLVFLSIGIFISALLLTKIVPTFPQQSITRIRQIIFTVVVALAMIKVFDAD